MIGKDSFDSDTPGDLADRERFVGARASPRNNDALKNLNSLLVSFAHLYMNAKSVSSPEVRYIRSQVFVFYFLKFVHFFLTLPASTMLANSREFLIIFSLFEIDKPCLLMIRADFLPGQFFYLLALTLTELHVGEEIGPFQQSRP